MLKLDQISLPINYNDKVIANKICDVLKVNKKDIISHEILKLSIDARRKPNIKYIASIGVNLISSIEDKYQKLQYKKITRMLEYEHKNNNKTFVVIGFGPSGMFAALSLARMGLKPIVVEQGKMVDERERDVLEFWNNGKLNRYSNVQFGEGGAGTFSDGKLNTNLNNEYCKIVINEFFKAGAPKEITYLNKPHIGSDNLKNIVKNIRKEIISLGGTFMFSTKFVDINIENNAIKSVILENVDSKQVFVQKADKILLCVGHSARDTFNLLYNKGVVICQKPFAMGVRIEQKQRDINIAQYGKDSIDGLPNADYKLVEHLKNGRSIFTFCMCPGGEVVASSSDNNEIVTNGMSNFNRDKENANSAVLVNILPSDYGSSHPLAGIEYQAKYEKLAFKIAGENYRAPAESVGSFLYDNDTKSNISYTYRPNLKFCKIKDCLPNIVYESLKLGLPLLDKKLSGFAKPENLLIAIESRSSCPLTIVRDKSYQSNIKGLYPIGEGAGYAGGIMSSAQDGIKVAEYIYNTL